MMTTGTAPETRGARTRRPVVLSTAYERIVAEHDLREVGVASGWADALRDAWRGSQPRFSPKQAKPSPHLLPSPARLSASL